MAEHLSPLDATFLELEEADPTAHMHVGAILLFDGDAPALDDLRTMFAARLPAVPRFLQRLSEPRTGGLTWPAWVQDDRFDLAAHTRAVRLPDPGGHDELMEWAGDFWSHRLDRDRPLWEVVVVEGLDAGRWALATKSHHCMVDGMSNVDLGPLLLDLTPEPAAHAAVTPPPAAPDRGLVGQALHPVEASVGAALHPRRTLRRARAMLDLVIRDEVVAAPRCSLNQPISARRRYEVVECGLDELKAIRGALGGTVNDVVLTLATTGLRALLEHRAEPPPARGLRAMVPVDVRTAAERMRLGNRVTSLFVDLPVQEPDPLDRHLRVIEAAGHRKHAGQAEGSSALIDLFAFAPPVLHAQLARALFASRLFNVTVTNIPGPQFPLYAFGCPMVAAYPLVPLAAEHAVGIAVASYDGRVAFGINADHRADDLWVIGAAIRDGLAELVEIAGVQPAGAAAAGPG